MKTPRELILARHRAALPRLDAIRHRQVAALRRGAASRRTKAASGLARWRTALRERMSPVRPAWVGLGVAWLLVLALRLPLYLAPAPVFATPTVAPPVRVLSPVWRAELAARQRLRADLLGLRPAASAPSDRPASEADRPRDRSELRVTPRAFLA
jgi:hypothetical protein